MYYNFKEYGYEYKSANREVSRGGGVAILWRPNIKTKTNLIKLQQHITTFEHISLSIKMGKHFINHIYRPPYSSKHPFTVKDFLLEFDQLLSYTLELKGHFLLFEDLNINCSDLTNQNIKDLLSLLKT